MRMEFNYSDKNEAVFRGGPMQSYWYADEHYPYHLKAFAVLDTEVDPVQLKKAWDRTKQIYPVIDWIPQVFDEDIYFFDAGRESGKSGEGDGQVSVEGAVSASEQNGDTGVAGSGNEPMASDAPVCPGGEATAGRAIALTYSGNTITLTAYHSLVDEFGIRMVLNTLLRAYQHESYGASDPEFKPEDIYVQNTMLVPEDYKPQPIILYGNSAEIFYDDSIPYDMNEPVTASCIRVSRRAFMEIAAEYDGGNPEGQTPIHHSCPEAVLSAIAARTVYELYPDERRALSLDMLTDFRGVFGIHSSIAPCSKCMPLVVSYEEIMGGSFEEAVRRILSLRETQTSEDYLKTYLALDNTYAVLGQKRSATAVAYMDVNGENAGLPIRQVAVSYLTKRSVLMIGYGESMWIYLQFGDRTEDYINAMMHVMESVGIEAAVTTQARRVPVEKTEAQYRII